jgi:hypothetical protein
VDAGERTAEARRDGPPDRGQFYPRDDPYDRMEDHRATFEIDSKTDAHAVERLLDRLYDSVREESRTVRADTEDSTATLAEFESVREAARRPRPGRLTVVLEQRDEPFETTD